jgi:hypothetical protein
MMDGRMIRISNRASYTSEILSKMIWIKMIAVRTRIGRMMYGRHECEAGAKRRQRSGNNKKLARKIILPSIILQNTLLQSELRVVR